MFTIEELKRSGVLASLAKRSKFPYVEEADYDGSFDGVVYTLENSETDDDGSLFCDLAGLSFDDRFTDEFLDTLWEDWLFYAVIPPSDDDAPFIVVHSLNEDCPDIDDIRILDGEIYWDDDEWFLDDEELEAKVEAEKLAKKQADQEWLDWWQAYGKYLSGSRCDSDYTSKPQSAWSEDDWKAFKSFSPVKDAAGWREWEVMGSQNFRADRPQYKALRDCIDVSDWDRLDWCYYWYVNGMFLDRGSSFSKPYYPLEDRFAWTRRQSSRPNLERQRVRREEYFDYRYRQEQYFRARKNGWICTPYGNFKLEQLTPSCVAMWGCNVGIPFVYAHSSDYDFWLRMNLDAQNKAIERFGGPDVPIAATPGWMGSELEPPSLSLLVEAAGETEDDDGIEEGDSNKKFRFPFFRS